MGIDKEYISKFIEPVLHRKTRFPNLEQCKQLSEKTVTKLHKNGLTSARQVTVPVSTGKTEVTHSIVLISEADVSDVSDGPIIIDPGAKRFADETDCEVDLGSVEKINSIEVFSPSDYKYEFYKI